MGSPLRFRRLRTFGCSFAITLSILLAAPSARASSPDETVLDATALAQLETRAATAKLADQCFLYAQLTHSLTELAGRQIADGQLEQAEATIKHIDAVAEKIHATLAQSARHLQDAEMLMHHTTRRLSDMLHTTSADQHDALLATLRHLDQVHAEVLSQVFAH